MAYFDLEKFDETINDCDKALELSPDLVKAMYRKACAYREKLDLLKSLETLKTAISLDGDNE